MVRQVLGEITMDDLFLLLTGIACFMGSLLIGAYLHWLFTGRMM